MTNSGARRRVLPCVIAILLAVAAAADARKDKSALPRIATALAAEPVIATEREALNAGPRKGEPAPGSPEAGIKVHGHWKIVVRNPDGSIASRHEFENSLMPGGQKFLAALLARQTAPFNWAVTIGQFCGTPAAVTTCNLVEPAVANDAIAVHFYGPTMVPVLSISAPTAGADAGKFIITGSVTAVVAGQVGWVQTAALSHNTAGLLLTSFTSTNASQQAIAVQAGQAIDVSVVISFS